MFNQRSIGTLYVNSGLHIITKFSIVLFINWNKWRWIIPMARKIKLLFLYFITYNLFLRNIDWY